MKSTEFIAYLHAFICMVLTPFLVLVAACSHGPRTAEGKASIQPAIANNKPIYDAARARGPVHEIHGKPASPGTGCGHDHALFAR